MTVNTWLTRSPLINCSRQRYFVAAAQYLHNPPLTGKRGRNEFTFEVHVPDEPDLPGLWVVDAVDAHVDDGRPFFHHVGRDQTRDACTTRDTAAVGVASFCTNDPFKLHRPHRTKT